MNLSDALTAMAERFGLDAEELIAYASEDTVGGYSPNPAESKWDCGSIFDVEGQVLYALIRATKPTFCLNLGGWKGCSAAHMLAALKANGHGQLVSVDLYPQAEVVDSQIEYVTGDAVEYMSRLPKGKADFVFEDVGHSEVETRAVWSAMLAKGKRGAWIISHDNLHATAGAQVTQGIREAGVSDYLSLLVEPSDCGLAIARRE